MTLPKLTKWASPLAALLLLATANRAAAQIQKGDMCWLKTETRGAGTIPTACPAGTEQDATGALCYPKCQSGYTGVGPLCWTIGFPWTAYGRGVGVIKDGCPSGQVLDAGLCYPKCNNGYSGVGPVCWGNCGGTYPVACGLGCAKSVDDCARSIASQVLAPLEVIANIGLTVATGGVGTVVKNLTMTGAKAGLKEGLKDLTEAAIETAASTLYEGHMTGQFDYYSLDITGVAKVVDAYNYPVCTNTYAPPAALTPQPFRVVPAGVAGGSLRSGETCEAGSFPQNGKCFEVCYGTATRAGSQIPRKDTYYCDYGSETPDFQPDSMPFMNYIGRTCSSTESLGQGLACLNGKIVEKCYGTQTMAGNAVPRTPANTCAYGTTGPVKQSQASWTFGGKTLAYGIDPFATGNNLLSLIGGRWSFVGDPSGAGSGSMRLAYVAAANDGSLWGLDYNTYTPKRWNGSGWTNAPGINPTRLAVGSKEDVWAFDSLKKEVYRWNQLGWTRVRGQMEWVSVGSDGDVWGLNNGVPYHYESSAWVKKPGATAFISISVGHAGQVYGLTSRSWATFNRSQDKWVEIMQQPNLATIHVGGSGLVLGVTNGTAGTRKVLRLIGNGRWSPVEDAVAQVAPL